MNAIEFTQLTKTYGKTVGIEQLDMSIRKGEIFGFLGQNGAGKTTTIRCLLNILIPSSGICKINGQEVTRFNPEIKENIGYLPGELNVPGHYKVQDFIDYIASLRKRPSDRIDELVDMFDVPMDKRFSQLSKGNKQKVGVVLAFMSDPDILILDEPTSGLDPIYQQKLYDLILSEKKRGKTVFFSSHNLDEVQRICDRVAIIREGQLVSIENVRDLADKVPRRLHSTLENMDVSKIQALGSIVAAINEERGEVELLVQNGHSLTDLLGILGEMGLKDLSYPPASLESYFLSKYRSNGE